MENDLGIISYVFEQNSLLHANISVPSVIVCKKYLIFISIYYPQDFTKVATVLTGRARNNWVLRVESIKL